MSTTTPQTANAPLVMQAKGDEVATAGGIIGKVTRLSEGFLHIEIANNVEVQIQRSAVVQVLPKGTAK